MQADAVRSGRVEVGFACGPVEAEGIREQVLVKERFVLVLPRKHPLAARRAVPLRALDELPFVAVRPNVEPAWAGACARALARAGVVFREIAGSMFACRSWVSSARPSLPAPRRSCAWRNLHSSCLIAR